MRINFFIVPLLNYERRKIKVESLFMQSFFLVCGSNVIFSPLEKINRGINGEKNEYKRSPKSWHYATSR